VRAVCVRVLCVPGEGKGSSVRSYKILSHPVNVHSHQVNDVPHQNVRRHVHHKLRGHVRSVR